MNHLLCRGDYLPTWSHLTSKLDDEQLTASDRLVRMLHTLNHFRSGDPSDCALLIVDVNARFLSAVASNHGWAFKRVLEAIGLRAEQFVIRLSVEGIRDYATLGYVCDNYRRNGFHTALAAQDFVEAGNLTGQIRPDYLFIRPDQHWSSANISGLAEAAARFHVNVIASSITDASQVLAVKQAGIQLITE